LHKRGGVTTALSNAGTRLIQERITRTGGNAETQAARCPTVTRESSRATTTDVYQRLVTMVAAVAFP
jgi:hypothetical protein